MFTPCDYCARTFGNSAWRAIACSVECGIAYFAAVAEARNPKKTTRKKVKTAKPVEETEPVKESQENDDK